MKAISRRRLFGLCVSAFFFTLFINADTYNHLTFSIEDFEFKFHDSVMVITPNTMDYMFEDDVTQPAIPFMIYKKQIEFSFF